MILSYDEKPGIQALATVAPDLPPKPGDHPTVARDYEYKRLGTLTLMAALNLVTGAVIHQVRSRSRSCEFVQFLQNLDAVLPAAALICILLDNHSAHTSKETMRYLASRPGRFEFVYLPKHASWLNAIEGFFSKCARSLLRHIRVESIDELSSRIDAYINLVNQTPTPPNWTFGVKAAARAP